MKVPEPTEERPIAWSAILEDEPVYASNAEEVGVIVDVLGAEDIFHGIVVRAGPEGNEVMVPAKDVTTITNARVITSLTPEEFRVLPPYQAEASFQLGFVGMLRKHLGWVSEGEHDKRGTE